MIRLVSILVVAVAISGCAYRSAVMNTGDDTYQVSATASPIRGGSTGAREMALTSANEKCSAIGKKIDVSDVRSQWAFPAASAVTVSFACR